jgi:hypothetical protein
MRRTARFGRRARQFRLVERRRAKAENARDEGSGQLTASVVYELSYRPSWVSVPLQGVLRVLEEGGMT